MVYNHFIFNNFEIDDYRQNILCGKPVTTDEGAAAMKNLIM